MKNKETKNRENTKVARHVSKVRTGLCPSTSQPCKGVGPTGNEVQNVWFGRGRKGPRSDIPSSPLLGMSYWEDIFTKKWEKGRSEPSNTF